MITPEQICEKLNEKFPGYNFVIEIHEKDGKKLYGFVSYFAEEKDGKNRFGGSLKENYTVNNIKHFFMETGLFIYELEHPNYREDKKKSEEDKLRITGEQRNYMKITVTENNITW
jgi:hypothetical protein